MNTAKNIRNAMRRNEQEVLDYLRQAEKENRFVSLFGLSDSWFNALLRLKAAGKVHYTRGRGRYAVGSYYAAAYARPVTKVSK